MKKLVLVVAMFMFVCGGSSAKASLVALAANVNDTVVTDTTSKDKPAEPVKE